MTAKMHARMQVSSTQDVPYMQMEPRNVRAIYTPDGSDGDHGFTNRMPHGLVTGPK